MIYTAVLAVQVQSVEPLESTSWGRCSPPLQSVVELRIGITPWLF